MSTTPSFPTRSQSRAEGNLTPSRIDTLPVPTPPSGQAISPTIQIPATTGSHIRTSPQKSIRTYDSKLISREMDRLGMSVHPSPHVHAHSLGHPVITHAHSLPHSMVPAGSSSTLTLVPSLSHSHSVSATIGLIPSSMSGSSSAPPPSDTPWLSLHVHVLPLFNGEPLRAAVEDLNSLVKKHLQSVVARAPARALSTLESDVKELLATGMITLNSKLTNIDEDKLLSRIVDTWSFFWDQVLPYVEGVFLPLQSDQLLLSLMRTSKPVRPTSPTHSLHSDTPKTATLSAPPIDVRKLTLRSFRDAIILPLFERMHSLLNVKVKDTGLEYPRARLQQMLLVLSSIQAQSLTLGVSSILPSPGEHAISHLLAAIRNPSSPLSPMHPYASNRLRPPSLGLSSFRGNGRDRRGRIARKDALDGSALGFIARRDSDAADNSMEDASTLNGNRTAINGHATMTSEDLREKEFLDSLRSPDLYQGEEEGRFAGTAEGVQYNVEYDYDSDEHSDDDEYQTTRGGHGVSMTDWDQHLAGGSTEGEGSLELRRDLVR